MNPKTHLRLFCVLLAACLLLPLAAACRQGGEGTGTQTGAHTGSPGTESGTSGSGETTGEPDDPIIPNDTGFSVSRLRVDSQTLPLGLDNAAPLFSWNMTVGQEDTVRGRVQTAYRVLVASDRGLLESGTADMWDSGTVQDGASVNIRYGGAPLLPMTRYFWTVQVTDGNGGMQCAPVAWFETGVGEDGFADASWIGGGGAPAISAKRAGYGRQAAPQTDESRRAHSFSAAHSGWRKERPLRTRSCCLPPMTAEPCI